MHFNERIEALEYLGTIISSNDTDWQSIKNKAYLHNPWFTPTNIDKALDAIHSAFLDADALKQWAAAYGIPKQVEKPITTGLVMAGNIPMVGFHDLLCVFVAGHFTQYKPSEKDRFLLPGLIDRLVTKFPAAKPYFSRVDRLKNFDAVIATGSDNAFRYFSYYFDSYPHILRKNRNSIAILTGDETEEELEALIDDVLEYFGLGCRNVTKLWVPRDYDFQILVKLFDQRREILDHNKYKNNVDYTRTLYLMNQVPHIWAESIMIKEDPNLVSRIGVLHYETYDTGEIPALQNRIKAQIDAIQCVVSRHTDWAEPLNAIPFGTTQNPKLSDYADGIDTLDFLVNL